LCKVQEVAQSIRIRLNRLSGKLELFIKAKIIVATAALRITACT